MSLRSNRCSCSLYNENEDILGSISLCNYYVSRVCYGIPFTIPYILQSYAILGSILFLHILRCLLCCFKRYASSQNVRTKYNIVISTFHITIRASQITIPTTTQISFRNKSCYPLEDEILSVPFPTPSPLCGSYHPPPMPEDIANMILGVDLPALAPPEKVIFI
jgi:hypothetical protein